MSATLFLALVNITNGVPFDVDVCFPPPATAINSDLELGGLAAMAGPAVSECLLPPANHGDRKPRNGWNIPTVPIAGAHCSVFPPALAERAVLAGCKPGGTVLDPFSGSGTTGMVAARHGHRYVGIDASRDYLDLSLRTRLAQGALLGEDAS